MIYKNDIPFSTTDMVGEVILSIRKLLGDELVEQLQMENLIFFNSVRDGDMFCISLELPMKVFANTEIVEISDINGEG